MGLRYQEALTQARHGKRIRREVWVTWLEWDGEELRFLLPKKLIEEFGTDYELTQVDSDAEDWIAK